MSNLKIKLAVIGAISAVLGAAPPALAATGWSAKAEPTEPGTAEAPKALDLTMKIELKDATGHPPKGTTTFATALPAEFKNEIAKFGVCPAETVEGMKKGTKTSADCPRDSILGSGQLTMYLPDLVVAVTTDKTEIINAGGGAVLTYFHFSDPIEVEGVVNGKVTQEGSPFGPVVTWDFSPAANSQPESRLQEWTMIYQRASTTASAQAQQPTSATPKKKKKLSCRAKARKLKSAKKRRAALRRCKCKKSAKKKCKKSAKKPKAQRARVSQGKVDISPFMSTGCAGGSWPLEARLTYKDASTEKVEAKITCAGPAPTPTPTPDPSPLCPPICSAFAQVPVLTAVLAASARALVPKLD